MLARMIYDIGENTPDLSSITSIDVVVREDEEDDALEGIDLTTLFFPGLIMFGLLTMSLNLEARFLRDRLNRVTHRLVTAPVTATRVVFEQRLYSASVLYVAAVVSAALGGVIWRIPPVGLAQVNLLSVAVILFVVGVNGTIFSLSNSRQATSAISSIVLMVLIIIGGSFFPTEFTPPAFQSISKLTPVGMANFGLTRALTGRELGISIPILFLYSLAFFAASVVVGRRRLA
jgi:ABC-2 type transport system permease protein